MNTATMPAAAQAGAGLGPVEQLFQISSGYILSSALQIAVKLEIADKIAAGAQSVQELAQQSGANEDALYRVLRALAAAGIFAETAPRRFALTPPAELMQKEAMHDLLLWISDSFHFRVYADMMHSVQTGAPAIEKTFGAPAFEYFARDRELSDVFNDAMTNFSAAVMPAVLEAYDFSGIGTLVDVAGGHGHVLSSILKQYPQMKGILFDLDHVIAGAVPKLQQAGLSSRCRTEIGSFFETVPQGGDAYIMKHIIHDWDDERAATILRHIAKALDGKPQGRVILLEAVVPPGNEPSLAKVMDLEMLLLPGGRERTAAEFTDLFARAGFELARIVPTASPLGVVEARPK